MGESMQDKDTKKGIDGAGSTRLIKTPKYIIREMVNQDYEQVYTLWHSTEGIGLSSADTRTSIAQYLDRNPGLSLVAVQENQLVGAVLCGHDGRRGFIHHLTIHKSFRRRGLGRELVRRCLSVLKRQGIEKCHIFVFADNNPTTNFWVDIGWTNREELKVTSKII
jgi:putative acetyltransferase